MNFFDERNEIWVKIFKGLNTVTFAFWLFMGLFGSNDMFLDLDYELFGFDNFLVWYFICILIGVTTYAFNMLLIQVVTNIEAIRKNTER